jgi:hypothetical protein
VQKAQGIAVEDPTKIGPEKFLRPFVELQSGLLAVYMIGVFCGIVERAYILAEIGEPFAAG